MCGGPQHRTAFRRQSYAPNGCCFYDCRSAIASPLLSLVHPVRGLARITVYGYSCQTEGLLWPGLPVLAASAGIGVAGLLVAQLTLAQLARRPRPADDADGARLDDVLRRMSARAVAGGAAALALVLAAGVRLLDHRVGGLA